MLSIVDVKSTFLHQIKAQKFKDEKLNKLLNKVVCGEACDAIFDACGVFMVRGHVCVPRIGSLSLGMVA